MVFVSVPIEIGTPPKRYDPIGHCIYCGAYSNKLSKEHIIAHGLAGDSLILPKASCGTCAEKTRDWETACLRHLWWPFRTRIGAPSSGKQPPKDFTVRQAKVIEYKPDGNIEAHDKLSEIHVGPMEFPFVFLAYKYPPPGILIGRHPDENVSYEVVAKINEEEFRKFAPEDKDAFRLAPLQPEPYARMLAKIAHSYAVAELGENAFRPVLREFIRGRPLQCLQWVGGESEIPPPEQHLHSIQWKVETVGGRTYVVVSLRLFSFMGSPQYHIVVGELECPLEQLPFLQQPLYTIDVKAALPVGVMVPLNQRLGGAGA